MKQKVLICTTVIVFVIAAFFCGRYMEKRENKLANMERCNTLITLALYKVENEDLTDESTMKVLISDLYAAYRVCDDPYAQSTLYDIWNTLLFDSNAYLGKEDVLAEQLLGTYQTKK